MKFTSTGEAALRGVIGILKSKGQWPARNGQVGQVVVLLQRLPVR